MRIAALGLALGLMGCAAMPPAPPLATACLNLARGLEAAIAVEPLMDEHQKGLVDQAVFVGDVYCGSAAPVDPEAAVQDILAKTAMLAALSQIGGME